MKFRIITSGGTRPPMVNLEAIHEAIATFVERNGECMLITRDNISQEDALTALEKIGEFVRRDVKAKRKEGK